MWISNLQEYKPAEIEISMPAFTKYTPDNIAYLMDLSFDEMWPIIDDWRTKFPDITITSETIINTESIKESLIWLDEHIKKTNWSKSKPLFLISEAVENVFESIVKELNMFDEYKVVTTKNNTFGGNVRVAGLLLTEDYDIAIEETLESGYEPDLIVMPTTSYYFDDLDLRGVSGFTLQDKYDIDVVWC